MKEIITDREDLFWAKMAGRDVDISTMTPPVASSMRERLMLEVADRISHGGGSSLPPAGADGNVLTADDGEWVSAAPPAGSVIVTLTRESDTITSDVSAADIVTAFNAKKPVFLFFPAEQTCLLVSQAVDMGGGSYMVSAAITDASGNTIYNVALSYFNGAWDYATNTVSVPSLPSASGNNGKVLGVDNGAYALVDQKPLILTGTWADGSGGDPNTVTLPQGTLLSDIYAAAEAGRAVFLEYTNDGTTTRMNLAMRGLDNGSYIFGFSTCVVMSSQPAVAAVTYNNTLVGTFELAV